MNDMFSHTTDPYAVAALLSQTPDKCRGCAILRGGHCVVFNRVAGTLAVRKEAIAVIVRETPLPAAQPTCTEPK